MEQAGGRSGSGDKVSEREAQAMEEGSYDIRTAVPGDLEQIKANVKHTMVNPDGKVLRKGMREAIERREMMVLERVDRRERTGKLSAYIEWYTKVDGTVTIKDLGTIGDEPNVGMAKRLVRELLRMIGPPQATVKLRDDLPAWNSIFEETPGFQLEGREYSRPHWRTIWVWTPGAERQERRGTRGMRR